MPPEKFTISTANTLFNGLQINERDGGPDVWDWLNLHFRIIALRSPDFMRSRLDSVNRTIVDELTDIYNPDILVLNEVFSDISCSVEQNLTRRGYHVTEGPSAHMPYPLTEAAVIASKWEGYEIPFKLPGVSSGSCGLEIPEIKTIVLALHPSAFNRRTREMQLLYTANKVKELASIKPGYDIVLAGDFNADQHELKPHFGKLPLKDHHIPTFPSNALFRSINRSNFGRIIRYVLGLHLGQRALDHILVPNHWPTPEITAHETTSDHMALVMEWNSIA